MNVKFIFPFALLLFAPAYLVFLLHFTARVDSGDLDFLIYIYGFVGYVALAIYSWSRVLP